MNEEYIDTIHRYIYGTMDSAERLAFETRLQSDPELTEALELERILLAGIARSGENELHQTISSVHQTLKSEQFFEAKASPTLQPFVMKRFLAVAATLVVLLGSIWFFMFRETQVVDTQALFEQNFQPQQDRQRALQIISGLGSIGMAPVQNASDSLRIALEQYEAGNYKEALNLLKAFNAAHPENDTAQYYIGVSYMAQEHYAKAIETLFPLSRSETSTLRNDALWNLALCYLKTENGEPDAREAFQELANNNDYANHRGAKAVLEQLLPK